MVKRRKIGLIYYYNEHWIGGTYYIENLIAALKLLPLNHQPELIIFTEQEEQFAILKEKVQYPYFTKGIFVYKRNIAQRLINKISTTLTGHLYYYPYNRRLHLVFPAAYESRFPHDQKFLYWIPDFQEHYLPHFFTPQEIGERKQYQTNLAANGRHIVFSSNSAKKDFNDIYRQNQLNQFVLPFAVTHPQIQLSKSITSKYNLPISFYICSNQFWKHKNHEIIIEAVAALKDQGKTVYVVFTGKESDYRNPEYFENLHLKIKKAKIEKNVFFLGFISREDQLALMKEAIAIIQPSLFEGWSTVIEDAKSLNSPIIASDIDVHKEQLQDYNAKLFFDPYNKSSLVNCLLNSDNIPQYNFNYKELVLQFAKTFYEITEAVINDKKS